MFSMNLIRSYVIYHQRSNLENIAQQNQFSFQHQHHSHRSTITGNHQNPKNWLLLITRITKLIVALIFYQHLDHSITHFFSFVFSLSQSIGPHLPNLHHDGMNILAQCLQNMKPTQVMPTLCAVYFFHHQTTLLLEALPNVPNNCFNDNSHDALHCAFFQPPNNSPFGGINESSQKLLQRELSWRVEVCIFSNTKQLSCWRQYRTFPTIASTRILMTRCSVHFSTITQLYCCNYSVVCIVQHSQQWCLQ